ncbi:alpha/beta hydrolase [Methylobacterium sp. WL103]|uniref:alpha/beta fold hydrolase n=1 Tax=Methylobacterium sp. WL103 TaxID=2603891 RepID=UPI0011C8115A|nr:alpha/beta hydrolase [Methylobacterium sp. WL103]TXN06451.1 alpha/beta hydrolase [Methylobacterium sp. WL103]
MNPIAMNPTAMNPIAMTTPSPVATGTDADAYTRRWLASGEIAHTTLRDGTRIRYVRVGQGPALVLTHTVRTQLDLFQRVIPLLSPHFTIYALDLPGFGWSDLKPGLPKDEPTLRAALKGFIAELGIARPILAGESIGATLSLSLAAELGDRVERVFAFNTYDYRPGLERSNLLASIIIKSVRAPVVGPVFAALENRTITGGIMSGGFHDPSSLPADLLDEYARVGARAGYSTASRTLLKALPSFVAARARYRSITAPVTLVWGDKDWSTPRDRAGVEAAVPSPSVVTLERTGHFSALERPQAWADIILAATKARAAS